MELTVKKKPAEAGCNIKYYKLYPSWVERSIKIGAADAV
jgi:hypothetical protein